MKKQSYLICTLVVLCCAGMALVDGLWQPAYFIKSGVKVLLFLGLPVLIQLLQKQSPFTFLKPDKYALGWGIGLGVATFAVIIGAYALLRPWLDLSAVPGALEKNAGVTGKNFLWVSIYIALCNSALEEFFFRGFAFLALKKTGKPVFAHCFSAGAFALYHAAILGGWFHPVVYLLILAALFGCGLFFNFLDSRRERIWVSWLVHMCANLAINLIGCYLLGIFS